jgi:hypothetical protein
MTARGMDRLTIGLLGLEEVYWGRASSRERFLYNSVCMCFLLFLGLSIMTSIRLMHLVSSSIWFSVPAGLFMAFLIASVVRFSLVILRRSIFDLEWKLGPGPNRFGIVLIPPKYQVTGSIQTQTGGQPQGNPQSVNVGFMSRIKHMLAEWRALGDRRGEAVLPGFGAAVRLTILFMMALLVLFPLVCLVHYDRIEEVNAQRRSVVLQEYERDMDASLNVAADRIRSRMKAVEDDITALSVRFGDIGLLDDKRRELQALAGLLQAEEMESSQERERRVGLFRKQVSESRFVVHSFYAAVSMPAFMPLALLVFLLIAAPHAILFWLKKWEPFTYAEESSDFYTAIIEEEFKGTEDEGYAQLKSLYGYEPGEQRRNSRWENPPFNTVRRKWFPDRKRIGRRELEQIIGRGGVI